MRAFAACAVLVAAFLAALLVGRAGGEPEENAAAPAEVKTIKVPDDSVKAPKLANTGSVPDLKPKPVATSTPSTSSTPAASAPTITPSAPSTPPASTGDGGGGSTPTARPPG